MSQPPSLVQTNKHFGSVVSTPACIQDIPHLILSTDVSFSD